MARRLTVEPTSEIDKLCAVVADNHGSVDRELLGRAWEYAESAHEGYQRLSGGTYFAHVRDVAEILAKWRAPSDIVAAGLLHDVVKSSYSRRTDKEALIAQFGAEIASLVHATAHLGRFSGTMVTRDLDAKHSSPSGIGAPRTSIAAVEVRRSPIGVVVKLADRQQNLCNLEHLDPDRQQTFLNAINFVFAPLANKLGMRRVADLLQTEALRIQEPALFDASFRIRDKCGVQERLEQLKVKVGRVLSAAGVEADVRIREPSVREVHSHTAERDNTPSSVAELFTLDIGVSSHEGCYRALCELHREWAPHDGFLDTLCRPLAGGHRLLTSRVHVGANTTMVRIATHDYWLVNNCGITAQWHGVDASLLPLIEPLPARTKNQIMLLTPKGDVKYMQDGVTVLDFAFEIHTSIGHRFLRATINGRPAEQGDRLADGDVVHILTSPNPTLPDPEWESFVTTDHARRAIQRLSRRLKEVELVVDAYDRAGLVHDIAGVCREQSLSMPYIYADSTPEGKAIVRFSVTSVDAVEVKQLRNAIREHAGVLQVYRSDIPEQQQQARRLTATPILEGGPFGEGPASGSSFVGRKEELSTLMRALKNQGKNSAVLIWGQRRVGKTSLLHELVRNYVRSEEYVPVLIDLAPQLAGPRATTTGEFLYDLARRIAEAVVNSRLTIPRHSRWMQDPLRQFRLFMDRLAQVAGTQSVLIVVDEFEALRRLREVGPSRNQVFLTLRSLVQHSPGVNFLFCGGGILPELRRRSQIGSLINTVACIEIDHLSATDAEEMLVRPRSEIEFTDGALRRLIGTTRGHPYYLQLLGRRLVEGVRPDDRPVHVGEAEVEGAIGAFLSDPATAPSAFDHYWMVGREFVRHPLHEDVLRLATLASIAHLKSEGEDVTLGTMIRYLGRWVPDEKVDTAISDLRAYRTLEDHGGYLAIRLPLLESWLRTSFPKERIPLILKSRSV